MTSQRRRDLLKLLLATPLAACRTPMNMTNPEGIVVVGAGIIGASIALHLSRIGIAVTVIDKVGPATHASRGTLAWINATWAKQPKYYHRLAQESVAAWRRLSVELELPVRWGGSIEWFDDPEREALLVRQIAEQARWGEPARMVDAVELASMEPHMRLTGATQAAFSGNDGAVDPVRATQLMLAAAQANGAQVIFPCELLGIDELTTGGFALQTSTGELRARKVVLATGAAVGAAERFAEAPIPQRSTPGVIAVTKPMPRIVHHVLAATDGALHQRNDGRIVMGEHNGPPDTDAHAERLREMPHEFPTREFSLQHAERLRRSAQVFLPDIASAEFEEVYIGWRPLPLDGHPVIGPSPKHPDIYIALMHSGVTLAPVVGELAAAELSGSRSEPLLDSFRADREFTLVRRY